jgi:hypothetical protein
MCQCAAANSDTLCWDWDSFYLHHASIPSYRIAMSCMDIPIVGAHLLYNPSATPLERLNSGDGVDIRRNATRMGEPGRVDDGSGDSNYGGERRLREPMAHKSR